MLKPILALFTAMAAAADPAGVPLGHRDFYPSPQRPVGFRGDGNGYFPGATPVTEWRERTRATKTDGARERPADADDRAVNIVWKVEMPAWANTQPIVVGDRVFTTAEPNLLVCVDARSGEQLWSAAANPWELIGVDKLRAEKAQALYDIWRDALPHFDRMRGDGAMARRLPSREFKPIADLFLKSTLPRIVKALEELDPNGRYVEAAGVTAAAVDRYTQGLAEAEKNGSAAPFGKHDPIWTQMDRLSDVLAARIDSFDKSTDADRKKNGRVIPLDVPWGHLVGFCMSAPVSDGRHVFVSFGQGQTACYDLNGKLIWAVHHQPYPERGDLSSIASPLLVGDVLVDVHGSMSVLRGLDKRTGKTLWQAPVKGEGTRVGGGYYVGSHKVVRLINAGTPVDVIVTTLCNIIRASDGLVLGSLPFDFPPSGGPSIVSDGDVVMKGAVGDDYRAPYIAYRLRFASDKVEAEEVWRTPRRTTPGYQSVMLSPNAMIMASTEHAVLDPSRGAVLFRGSSQPIGGYSNIQAGDVFLWAESGSGNWGGRGPEVFGTFGAADVADPKRIRIIADKNVLGGVNKPRVPAMEKYAPELYALPFYKGNAYGWPAHFLHTDTAVFPSGNGLFVRSVSHLYCIGDPAVPYDWNAGSRPEEVTRSLTGR